MYVDRLDYWYPAIRFRKDDATIAPIRAKEKGDWNKLSAEEKKLCKAALPCDLLSRLEADLIAAALWTLPSKLCVFLLNSNH